MNRDTVIALAREAGLKLFNEGWTSSDNGDAVTEESLERFAALIEDHITFSSIHTCNPGCTKPACVARQEAVKAEREECAKIAQTPVYGEQDDLTMVAKNRIAAAIRSRT